MMECFGLPKRRGRSMIMLLGLTSSRAFVVPLTINWIGYWEATRKLNM